MLSRQPGVKGDASFFVKSPYPFFGFLSRGADPEAGGAFGSSPLASAAWQGHLDCCLMLLEAGADPARRGSCGRTPAERARTGFDPSVKAAELLDAWAEAKALSSAAHAPAAKTAPKAL